MDILLIEESINILANQTHPICFSDLLNQISHQLDIESEYIKDVLWNSVINSPLILTSSPTSSDVINDEALHLICNEIRFRRLDIDLYESVIKNTQRIRVLLAISRRKYEGYWQSELSYNLSIDPKNLFQLLQILCKQQVIIKLNMPFYVKSGTVDKMCFSTSSASSNSILFHHKYFVFDKFPDYIKVQMTNLSLDLFGDSLLDFINKTPDSIAFESSALNYYINLASTSASKLCAVINPKVAEKGFNSLLTFLIEQGKIARALTFCKDTGKNELVLVSSKSPYFMKKTNENDTLKSLYLYQLNSTLTLPEMICKLVFLNSNKGIMATEICQILSIRLKPLTKILNSLCPEYIKKIPERSGKLFYYRYYLNSKSIVPQADKNQLVNDINDNSEFYSWLRNNLEQFSSGVGKFKGKINTCQFRGRIAIIIEYLKRHKFASPIEFAKAFCKVEKSEKLVDKRTVNRLISHTLQYYRNIKQIKFFQSQNALVPVTLIYDSNLTNPEAVKKQWAQSIKPNSNTNQVDLPNGKPMEIDNNISDLPLIEGVVVTEMIDRPNESTAFSQKILISNGFVIPIMTRLKIAHEFLITLDDSLLKEKSILNQMPLGVFLRVIGCGYPIKDQQWIQQNTSCQLEFLPQDVYKLLMFGASVSLSNTKNRRVATQILTKLCLLLSELGLIDSVTEPAPNGTVYQYWKINRNINKSFCNKDLNCFYCNKGSIPMNSIDDLEKFWLHLKYFIWYITDLHPDDYLESYFSNNENVQIPKVALIRKNWKGLSDEPTSFDTFDIEILSKFIDKHFDHSDEFKSSGLITATGTSTGTSIGTGTWWEKLECAQNLTSHYSQKINDVMIYKLISLLWGFNNRLSKSPIVSWQKCQQIISKLLQDGRPFKKKSIKPVKNSAFKYIFRSFIITTTPISNQVLAECFSPISFKELRQLAKYWSLAKIIHKVPVQSNEEHEVNSTISILSKYRIGKNGNSRLFGTLGSFVELQQLWQSIKNNCFDSTISRLEMLASDKGRLIFEDYQHSKVDKRIYSGGLERHYEMIQQPYPLIKFTFDKGSNTREIIQPPIPMTRLSDPIDGFNILNIDYETNDSISIKHVLRDIDKKKVISVYNQLIESQENGILIPLYNNIPKELTLLYLLKLAFRVPDVGWRFIGSQFAKNLLNIKSDINYCRPDYVTDELWIYCGINISSREISSTIKELGIDGDPILDKFSPTIFTNLIGAPNFPILALVALRIYSMLRYSPGLTLYEINNKLCLLEVCETLDIINLMIKHGLVNQLITNYDNSRHVTYLANVTPNLEKYEKIIDQIIAKNSQVDEI